MKTTILWRIWCAGHFEVSFDDLQRLTRVSQANPSATLTYGDDSEGDTFLVLITGSDKAEDVTEAIDRSQK